MGRIINSTYITLDGVIEHVSEWPSLDGGDTTGNTIQTELLLACDAVLLGRETYESFASVWQGNSGDPYTDKMNSMTKYVVSSTLTDPDWANTTVINEDVVAAVDKLKAEPGGDIVQYGFGPIAHTLLENGLIDEIRLWIHPFFFGKAEPKDLLFQPGNLAKLRHTDTTTLKSGILIVSYDVLAADK